MTRYETLANELANLIATGILRAGERLPSLRALSTSHRVSAATVTQAYQLMEDRGLIAARPRSGYYVNANWKAASSVPEASRPPAQAAALDVSELVFEVLGEIRKRHVVPLGSAFPSPLLFPLAKLAQYLGKAARQMDPWKTVEDLSPGSAELRRQIARRYSTQGVGVLPDDIVITSGALEALNLCLEAVTQRGDVVAIESPCWYGALQAIERLGLRAVQIATDPVEGINLASLETAIRTQRVKACWLMPTFQNPTGALMPGEKKKALVKLLSKHGVAMVEDDVYAELHFGRDRPLPAKAFDREGLVLHCGSFSKSLAPGYRIGWCVPGKFMRKVERLKLTTSLATSIPVQEGIADYLGSGGYDHHLRGLRKALELQQRDVIRVIREEFPPGTRVTRPSGGYFCWVEMAKGTDALKLHRTAIRKGITIAPGPIFAPARQYSHCMRINTGNEWSVEAIRALARG